MLITDVGWIRPARVAVAILLVGCVTDSKQINLATYAPVIDVQGQGYDVGDFNKDLGECRVLGTQVQAAYKEQQEKERQDAFASAMVGAFLGAVVGQAVGDNNGYHTGRSATAGALYGGAIGGAARASNMDYTNMLVKFGPTAIVDRCMKDRGYKILSAEGFGGG